MTQENKIQKKHFSIGVAIGATIALLLIGYGVVKNRINENFDRRTIPTHGFIAPADFSVDNNLVGASDDLFIGRVVSLAGNRETKIAPRTQYFVEIVKNIKGTLSGVVTVDQIGGYVNGQLVTIEGLEGNYLLKPGSTYLLGTRFSERNNWHTLILHPNASKLLTDDSTLGMSQLSVILDNDTRISVLEAAYPNEVLLNADILQDRTPNSFQSLPPEQKAAAQARADAARASLEASVVTQ